MGEFGLRVLNKMQFLLTPTLEAVGSPAPDLVIRGQLHKVAFKVLPHYLNQATQHKHLERSEGKVPKQQEV